MPKYVHDIQKKQHKERAQPQERKRLGLLQKKKDYKLRAKDYHDKQERLRILREKAANRNPDEYYHSMTSRKTDSRGVLVTDRESSESISVDEAKLLKTQDVNYIKTKRLNEMKQIEKLMDGTSNNSNAITFGSEGKHTVFLDDREEFEEFDVAKHFNTDKRLVDRKENRLTLEQLETLDRPEQAPEIAKKMNNKKLKKLKLIKQKLERVQQLERIEQKMDAQRELMKKGSKKKVVNKDGKVSFKWKQQRKR
ncbi:rRNA-processing protein [Saccharomycopsis crataegensis]|uniref:U3 small nucleolar RNA-associated protein 11 n=1 Tax=Saccharomycopsis crataegensis TaxID=43959 RepID=A0AAV5QU81_9ASCO|nr:rRNA-processing protein [Saccharomycopsis crataegensis]